MKKTDYPKMLDSLMEEGASLEIWVGPFYGSRGLYLCEPTKTVRTSPRWRFWKKEYTEIILRHSCCFCGQEDVAESLRHYVDGYGGLYDSEFGDHTKHYYFHPKCLTNGQNLKIAEGVIEIIDMHWEAREKSRRKVLGK